jgi:hypothetical protein
MKILIYTSAPKPNMVLLLDNFFLVLLTNMWKWKVVCIYKLWHKCYSSDQLRESRIEKEVC